MKFTITTVEHEVTHAHAVQWFMGGRILTFRTTNKNSTAAIIRFGSACVGVSKYIESISIRICMSTNSDACQTYQHNVLKHFRIAYNLDLMLMFTSK